MNKRELKALCSLSQQSIDEIVEAKHIDMRHSHTVSMDAETSFGSDMPAEARIIFQCGNRYFDQEINEYFMADDDRKLHPAHNLMVRNICISGNSAERCISSSSLENYEVCPFRAECKGQLVATDEVYFRSDNAEEYEGKKLCRFAFERFTKVCSICGKRHPVWMVETVEEKPVCLHCLESEVYATCEVSGKRFIRAKGKTIDGLLISPEVYNRECMMDEVFTHEYHLKSNMAKLPDGTYGYIPAIEASGNYGKCSHCGKYFMIDQIVTDADGYSYCNRCATAAVYPYHGWDGSYAPLQLDGEDAKVFFGVELELAGNPINAHLVAREMGDVFHCERDASIDSEGGGGFEVISQPMSWNYLKSRLPQIRALFRKLSGRGMKGHDTRNCGLHVHVTRSYFKTTEAMNGQKDATAEMFADALVNESFSENIQTFARRRSSNYYSYRSVGGILTKTKAVNHRYLATGHGVSVNFANRKTVEFRVFKSTLNPETYMACVELVKNIVEMANRMAESGKRVVMWHELAAGEFIPNYIAQQTERYGKRFHDVRFDAQGWNIEEVKTILKFKREFIKNLRYVNDHSVMPISIKSLQKAGII